MPAAPSRSQKTPQSQTVDKNARLLAAALELFEVKGFDGVTVPEIARKAGVATGTVYLYFKDKAALVNALYRHWKSEYNAIVLTPPPQGAAPRRAFAHYWQRMMLFARTYPSAMRFLDLHHHGAYLDAESRAMAGTYARAAEDFVAKASAAGAVRRIDPMLVVALMWGAAAGLVKFSGEGEMPLDAHAATEMEEALWRAIAT